MKKFIPIYFFLTYSLCVSAQEYANKQDSLESLYPQKITAVIKTNPAAIIWGNLPMPFMTSEYRFLYEDVTAPKQTIQLGFSYIGKGPVMRYIEKDTLRKNPSAVIPEYEFTGFRLQASYRIYWNEWLNWLGLAEKPVYAPKGFYVSPHASFATTKLTVQGFPSDYYIRANVFNVNLLSGCQFTLFEKVSVDVFAGLGYKQIQWFFHRGGIVKTINLKTDPDFQGYAKAIPNYLSPVKYTFAINFGYCLK